MPLQWGPGGCDCGSRCSQSIQVDMRLTHLDAQRVVRLRRSSCNCGGARPRPRPIPIPSPWNAFHCIWTKLIASD
ncbi:GL26598 [Drosophila persimilis]|uniref:GL26598 n=1 Tax=Drosophila persimilis TaxID=7234 RepID=B4GST7_DROPE|nr:GL26598 [Drosophila persimilis]